MTGKLDKQAMIWLGGTVMIVGAGGRKSVHAEFARARHGRERITSLCIARFGTEKSKLWTVTHVRSGLRITEFTGRDRAREKMLAAHPLMDWDLDGASLTALLLRDASLQRRVHAAIGVDPFVGIPKAEPQRQRAAR